MNICVIGTGYVGLVAGTCFSYVGNSVTCCDVDERKLSLLKNGICPIFEPKLEDMIKECLNRSKLSFSSDIAGSVKGADVCIIAVGTPENSDGSANLSYVYDVAKIISTALDSYKVIINKSTVSPGTADEISKIISSNTNCEFDVVSNPEFLSQGRAVDDFLHPQRVIIGSSSKKALEIVRKLYEPFLAHENDFITMDTKSAELCKYAANSFLALKISYANLISNLCDKIGANYQNIKLGMSLDERIGAQFLNSGIGFGGSCFPKDIKALSKILADNGVNCDLISDVWKINVLQRKIFTDKILNKFNNNVGGLNFAVWGLTFKPNTNDLREAPSVSILENLIESGANIRAYDPSNFNKNVFDGKINFFNDKYSALDGADALLVLTEWDEFRDCDVAKMSNLMKQKIIFDGRNALCSDEFLKSGFEYFVF